MGKKPGQLWGCKWAGSQTAEGHKGLQRDAELEKGGDRPAGCGGSAEAEQSQAAVGEAAATQDRPGPK